MDPKIWEQTTKILVFQKISWLEVYDRTLTLKKVYREKWVKQRGASKETQEGHENVYFWNDVPCKMTDFKQRVRELLKEDVFKLITIPGTSTRY